MSPPTTVYRVEWWRGKGWPICTSRHARTTTYDDEKAVRALLARIAARPTHDVLVGVFVGTVEWETVDLPRPFGDLAAQTRTARGHMAVLPRTSPHPVPFTTGKEDDGNED